MDKFMSQNPMESEPLADNTIEEEVKKPNRYKVILHNDDYTTMDFVVTTLVDVFQKTVEEAASIMLSIHEKGIGICGVYTREVAEFRVNKTMSLAAQAGFPLRCTMEKE